MSRRAFRAAVITVCATALTWVASCATILGLDEDLRDDPDADLDGPGPGVDATTPDAARPDAGPTGTDAAIDDSSAGDGGASDASDAAGPWALDMTFGDGGVAVLVPASPGTARVGTLELASVGDFVYVFGIGFANTISSARQVMFVFNASASPPTGSAVAVPDAGNYFLLGVLALTTDSTSSTRAVIESKFGEVLAYDPDPADASFTADIPNPFGVAVSRVMEITDSGFAGPGLTNEGGVEATIGTSVGAAAIPGTSGCLLLAQGDVDGDEWYGGYHQGSSPTNAVLLLDVGGQSSFAQLGGATSGDDFAVTDFARTDRGLFAVGYSGGSFAVWGAALDAGAPRTIDAGQAFTDASTYRSDYPYSFVRSVVCDQQIVASGAFGAPFLATFDATGMPVALLLQPDGGVGSALNLADKLPPLNDAGSAWYPGGLLANGDDVYATFSSGPNDVTWVVVRLTRTGGTP